MTGLGSGEHGKGTIVNVSSKGCTSCRMQAVCGRLPFKVTMCLVAVMFASCLKSVRPRRRFRYWVAAVSAIYGPGSLTLCM